MKEHGFKQRVLDTLKGHQVPRVMLFTDTETHSEAEDYIEVQKFTLGWVFAWESSDKPLQKNVQEEFFEDPVRYCEYFALVAKKYKVITLYGHNIFFDLQCEGFFKYFTDQGWVLDWIYDKGLTYIVRIKKGGMKITALSTTNYYDCSLKELGKMIGLEKEEIQFRKASSRQLKNYCHRDTEIVMRGMWYYLQFIKDNDLGRVSYTKSSQALVAYRSGFMEKKIYLHSDERSFDLERKAYMGGRTEAFRIGTVPGEDFIVLDVNGMYPFVMQKYKYPSKLVCMIKGEEMKSYTSWLGGYGMIAEVDIDTPEPAFAVRYKKKLIFPTGQFRAFLCTEALRYAVKKGYVKNFIRASLYIMDDLFSDYVAYFQKLRAQYTADNNLIMVKLCKYMHNCLYGKWGEREIITSMTDDHSGEPYLHREIWDGMYGGWWNEIHFMNKIIMTHPGGESNHSFPAIAAHITENARLELWNIVKAIGKDTVLYCDTDSVIIRSEDIDKVTMRLSDTEMGALKIQNRFSGLQIGGAKNYRSDQGRVIKGIPESAVETSPGVFQYDSFQRQAGCMKDGQITGVRITPVTRRLTHRYDKGQVGDDGKVKPYHFTYLTG